MNTYFRRRVVSGLLMILLAAGCGGVRKDSYPAQTNIPAQTKMIDDNKVTRWVENGFLRIYVLTAKADTTEYALPNWPGGISVSLLKIYTPEGRSVYSAESNDPDTQRMLIKAGIRAEEIRRRWAEIDEAALGK